MIKKILRIFGVFFLLVVWQLSGLAPIWQNPKFPPVIKKAHAATLTYVGGAESSGNSASFSVSLTGLTGGAGSAAQAGDLVVVSTGFVSTSNLNPGVSTTGYTEVADLYSNDTRDANFSVNWKIMSGTPDTSVSCNGSGSASNGAVCVVHVWRNVDQGTPLDVVATTSTGGNSAVPNSPTITPVTSGAVVISTGLGTGVSVDTSVTAPSGYGNQVDISVDPTNATIVGVSSKSWSGSGAEDPAAWTGWTTSTSDSWAAVTLAIRPIGNPPSLTVSQPDGTSDTVIVGTTYNITYDLSDSDSVATVDFYYDTNNSGLDGTAIASCQDQAEGSGVTCSWDTTGITAGDYYIYGIATDGVNPNVSDYSSGVITIQAISVSVTITSDGIVSYGTLTSGESQNTVSLADTQNAVNDGNTAEDFNIKTSAPAGWTLGSVSATDTFVHEFSTNGGSNWTKFTTADSYQTLNTNIATSGTQSFDLRFTAPNPSTSATQKTITVTIQAVQY